MNRTDSGRNTLGNVHDYVPFTVIAREMGLSVSRIYQIYYSAIDKLAHNPEAIITLTRIVETKYELRRNRQ